MAFLLLLKGSKMDHSCLQRQLFIKDKTLTKTQAADYRSLFEFFTDNLFHSIGLKPKKPTDQENVF